MVLVVVVVVVVLVEDGTAGVATTLDALAAGAGAHSVLRLWGPLLLVEQTSGVEGTLFERSLETTTTLSTGEADSSTGTFTASTSGVAHSVFATSVASTMVSGADGIGHHILSG